MSIIKVWHAFPMPAPQQKVRDRIGLLRELIEKHGVVATSLNTQLDSTDKSLLGLIIGLESFEGSKKAIENLSRNVSRSKYTIKADSPVSEGRPITKTTEVGGAPKNRRRPR